MTETNPNAGNVLTVIGGLILFLSGGCTLFFVVADLTAERSLGLWMVAPLVGGLPILIGLGLLIWGVRRRRAS